LIRIVLNGHAIYFVKPDREFGIQSTERMVDEKTGRIYGSSSRMIALLPGINRDKIEARYNKGVLTVKLPKTEEGKAGMKKIAIKSD
jgi:HSP20 family molecular chaperone IbpA